MGEGVDHHKGVVAVAPADDGTSHVVWTADVLPHALADAFGPLMAQGMAVMKAHLEAARP